MGGESVSPYPHRPKALTDVVDVVELLLRSTNQVPNARHLCVLHMFNSVTSDAA